MKVKILFLFTVLVFNTYSIRAQESKNSSSWQYGHCLKEVHFGGISTSNYVTITKDDSTEDYFAPHFVKDHPNGCDSSIGGIIKTQKPVAYVSGTKARVKACFYTDCTHTYYIRGLGAYLSENPSIRVEFPKRTVTPSGGQVIYDWTDADRIFRKNKVRHFEKFIIEWQISEDGINWVDIDESENTLYVTHDVSLASKKFHTLLDVSCEEANKETIENKIVDKLYSPFRKPRLEVKRASDGHILTYYNTQPAPIGCFTVAELLANGDGRCGAWADFLDQMIKVHGIKNSQVRGILPTGNPSGSTIPIDLETIEKLSLAMSEEFPSSSWEIEFFGILFLVKHWGAVSSNEFIPLKGDNYNEAKSDPGLSGLTGQGNVENPRSIFPNHAVVSYLNNLYDPSYGTFFTGTELTKFEDESIDAVRGTIITVKVNNKSKYYFWVDKPNTVNFEELKLY